MITDAGTSINLYTLSIHQLETKEETGIRQKPLTPFLLDKTSGVGLRVNRWFSISWQHLNFDG